MKSCYQTSPFWNAKFFREVFAVPPFVPKLPCRREVGGPQAPAPTHPWAGMSKQVPADETDAAHDEARMERIAKAMPSPTKTATSREVTVEAPQSVWEQWLASQRYRSETARGDGLTMKQRIANARKYPQSARAKPGQFDSKLATASGYTNTGKKATVERERAMEDAKKKEAAEVEDLKRLLSKTLYTANPDNYVRAGNVATAGLKKLPDGSADSIVDLRKRRVEEEALASVTTGRPAWDSSPLHATPPALKGCKPITPEPWARDMAVYEGGMFLHGAKETPGMAKTADSGASGKLADDIGKHVSIIQSDMVAYRRELAQGENKKQWPASARHYRQWESNGLMTPKTPHTGRSTQRSARKAVGPALSAAASERAERMKAKSPPKPVKTGGGK